MKSQLAQAGACALLMFCLFAFNVPSCATSAWFNSHQATSDDLVWARIYGHPAVDGPPYLYRPAVAQHCTIDLSAVRPHTIFPESALEAAWLYHPDCIQAADFVAYASQIGVQGVVIEALYHKIGASLALHRPALSASQRTYHTLRLVRLGQAALNAVFATAIVVWLAREFGATAYWLTMLSLPMSPWLTVFGHSVYWQLWSMLAPFAYAAQVRSLGGSTVLWRVLLWLGCGVLMGVKASMGYEFLTTVFLSIFTPLWYHHVGSNRGSRHFWVDAFALTLVCGASVGAVMWFHGHALGQGNTLVGLQSILERAAARTYPSLFSSAVAAAPDVDIGRAASWLGNLLTYVFGYGTYSGFFVPFVVPFTFFVLAARKSASRYLYQSTLFVAVLAPLSWFILAKGHSAAHTHISYVLWHVPLTWVGWAVVGRCLEAHLQQPRR